MTTPSVFIAQATDYGGRKIYLRYRSKLDNWTWTWVRNEAVEYTSERAAYRAAIEQITTTANNCAARNVVIIELLPRTGIEEVELV